MKALLLAAGFATRLYPLTRDRPKPLLEVRGRPVLSWLLDRVLELDDLDEIGVVSNAKFHAQFEDWAAGLDLAVPLRVIDDGATDDSNKLGGVADMALGLGALSDAGGEDVVVLAGDNLITFGLRRHVVLLRRERCPVMVARRIDGPVPPRRYGEVVVDSHGRIVRMREKPDHPESNLAATCIYFLSPEARALLASYMKTGRDKDAPGHFIAWLAQRIPVLADPASGEIFDIGNLESLERARAEFRPG